MIVGQTSLVSSAMLQRVRQTTKNDGLPTLTNARQRIAHQHIDHARAAVQR